MRVGDGVRLTVGPNRGTQYADAQLDDYRPEFAQPEHQPSVTHLRRRPPLRLALRARFSHPADELRGTAGFGFWNDPVGMTGRIRVRLPQAVWFFLAAAPSRMPLILDSPGQGWMASALAVRGRDAAILAPIAPLLALSMRLPRLSRWVWPWLRRRVNVAGVPLAGPERSLTVWREYVLVWDLDHARFSVDGETVAVLPVAPSGPLGLVIWIDNQTLVATPQGNLRSGVTPCPEQWLEIAALDVDSY